MNIDKILMVDDDAHVRRVAEISLRKLGKWKVTLACSGKEALELAKSQTPDLIIMDLSMPELDGFQTMDRLKESKETAMIPVIFMTGWVQEDELEKCKQKGAVGVIAKPFDPLSLPEQIKSLLNGNC